MNFNAYEKGIKLSFKSDIDYSKMMHIMGTVQKFCNKIKNSSYQNFLTLPDMFHLHISCVPNDCK